MSEEVKEAPTVEDFFRSVPTEVTKIPIFCDEDGMWFAYGHLEPSEMITAINAADLYSNGGLSYSDINPKDIQYYYAKLDTVDPGWDDEVRFTTCKPTVEGAFPVTMWVA